MSRANITLIVPNGLRSIIVTFACRDEERLSYRYEGAAASAILSGADPAAFSGERVSTPVGGLGDIMDAVELAELAGEVAGAIF